MPAERDPEASAVGARGGANESQFVGGDGDVYPSTSSATAATSSSSRGAAVAAAAAAAAAARDASGTSPPSWDTEAEAVLGLRGPLASLWALLGRLLDWVGVTWHRRELNSQSYQMMRHGLYSSLLTMAMLLGILTHCFLWEVGPAGSPTKPSARSQKGTSSCGRALKLWAVINTSGFLYEGFYNRLGLLSLVLQRRAQGYGSLGFPPPVWCVLVRHALALLFTGIGLCFGLGVVEHYGLDEIKSVVLMVVFFNALASIRCSRQCTVRLVGLELAARHAERRAFRERLASNVLTIAMFLEVPSIPRAQEQAATVLEEQTVVPYDPASFQEHPDCCICSREFDTSGGEIRRTRCGHVFHSACLGGWLRRSLTCPLCRQELAPGAQAPPSNVGVDPPAARPSGVMLTTSMSAELDGHHRQREELVQVVGAPGNRDLPV